MTADLLREAAALMRERAEAAERFDAHGPWRSLGQRVVRDESVGPALVMIAREGVPGFTSPVYSVTAAHIASWHPAVALAVADLLDNEANLIASVDEYAHLHMPLNGARVDLLLTVARAYLGRDS